MVGREKELAIRAALGATAARLARLSLTEASLIAIGAGIVGALLGRWGIGLLSVALEGARPGFGELRPAASAVVVIAAIATLVTLFGTVILPTISAARRDPSVGLGERSRRPMSPVFHYGVGDLMVVVQVALAVVLVLVTALFVRWFAELSRLEHPAASRDTYVTTLTTPAGTPHAARQHLYERVLDEVGANHAFEATALATDLPVLWRGERVPIVAASTSGSTECRAGAAFVSAHYFDVVRLPIERGTLPSGTGGVAAVVSAGAARTCWGDGSTQEWRVHLPRPPSADDTPIVDDWIPVVAVVANPFDASAIKQFITCSYVWVIGTRYWPQDVFLLLRPRPGAHTFAAELARTVRRASPDIAMEPIASVGDSNSETRVQALEVWVLAAIAMLSLLLAFTGVYAALSHSCARRLVEFGIRLALGAGARRLVIAAVAREAPLVAAGIVVGLVGTLWVTAITWRDLLVISALDPRLWIGMCAILGGAGLLASLGPALRAIRVDPISVLRAE
jgi:hypothetical protein